MGRIRTSEGQINPSGNTMRWRERKNDTSNIPTNGLKLYVIKDDNEVDFRIAYELNDKSGYRIKSLVDAHVTQDEEDETVYPVFHNTPSDSHGFNNDGQQVASGQYILKMTAPNYTNTLQMTFIK